VVLDITFWVLAVVAVVSAALVFVVDSMARATYALALSFVAVGFVLLLLQQNYVGVVTVLMMLMEMAIMAVYMVMFMGMNPALMPMSMVHSNRTALGVAVAAFVALGGGALLVDWPVRRGAPSTDVTAALGEALMGRQMLVMVVVSPVMVATIVGGVVLAAHRSRYDRFGDDLDQRPPRDPARGGVGR
jgi:NADH-quinone oxidoreductase subunit J